jgi:hypothetical protein
VGEWGAASFENDPASDWFLLVEEAVDPGVVIASALDSAVGESEYLGLDESCEALAAAELSASCAGHKSARLPDNVRYWVDTHPHQPHDSEIDQTVQRSSASARKASCATIGTGASTGTSGSGKSTTSSHVWNSLGAASRPRSRHKQLPVGRPCGPHHPACLLPRVKRAAHIMLASDADAAPSPPTGTGE